MWTWGVGRRAVFVLGSRSSFESVSFQKLEGGRILAALRMFPERPSLSLGASWAVQYLVPGFVGFS